MSEKPKKRGESPIEFVAPYPIDDCLRRIRETKLLEMSGFKTPGFDPSYVKDKPEVYHFRIRRTWYDNRARRHISIVSLEGYLKAIDATSTAVFAKTYVSIFSLLTWILAAAVLGLIAFSPPHKPINFLFLIGGIFILLFCWTTVSSDKQDLTSLIHRAMSDDLR